MLQGHFLDCWICTYLGAEFAKFLFVHFCGTYVLLAGSKCELCGPDKAWQASRISCPITAGHPLLLPLNPSSKVPQNVSYVHVLLVPRMWTQVPPVWIRILQLSWTYISSYRMCKKSAFFLAIPSFWHVCSGPISVWNGCVSSLTITAKCQ